MQEYAPNVKLMTLRIYTAFGVSQTPIIFKLKRRQMTSAQSICFTFQSGSIQILSDSISSMYCSNFTFQSGSIQIWGFSFWIRPYPHFTFQSGSIQIWGFSFWIRPYPHFTFQSGSIQITLLRPWVCTSHTLHSNLVLFKWRSGSFCYRSWGPLHSNLVLFKW